MGNTSEMDEARQPRLTAASRQHLTPRQLEVLALLCEGLPNKQIGRQLNIANATVKIHVANILRIMNVCSRVQAVVAALNSGLDLKCAGAHPSSVPRSATIVRLVTEVGAAQVTDTPWSLLPLDPRVRAIA